jgi:hypothetical protein
VDHLDIVDAVRVGAAAGALKATRHGNGSGQGREIKCLASRIVARPIGEEGGTRHE